MSFAALAAPEAVVRRATANRGLFDGRDGVNDDLIRWWIKFQIDAARVKIPLRVVWGVRNREQQDRLHALGRSRARFGHSPHNFGLALDIIHTTRAWEGMTPEHWEILGVMGKETARKMNLKVEWGGDWNRLDGKLGWDPAHWQIANWRQHLASRL